MNAVPVQVQAGVAWWLYPYLYALYFVAAVCGCEVDEGKAEKTIRRAVILTVVK